MKPKSKALKHRLTLVGKGTAKGIREGMHNMTNFLSEKSRNRKVTEGGSIGTIGKDYHISKVRK